MLESIDLMLFFRIRMLDVAFTVRFKVMDMNWCIIGEGVKWE